MWHHDIHFCCDEGSGRKKLEMDKWWDRWTEHNIVPQMYLESHTYHIIQETKTIVASLNELKKRIRSSPSSPSFFSATPKTRANSTSPRIFIPSISVPTGICRGKKKGLLDTRLAQNPTKGSPHFVAAWLIWNQQAEPVLGRKNLFCWRKPNKIWMQSRYKPPYLRAGMDSLDKDLPLPPLIPFNTIRVLSVTRTGNLPSLLRTSSTADAKQHGHQSHTRD